MKASLDSLVKHHPRLPLYDRHMPIPPLNLRYNLRVVLVFQGCVSACVMKRPNLELFSKSSLYQASQPLSDDHEADLNFIHLNNWRNFPFAVCVFRLFECSQKGESYNWTTSCLVAVLSQYFSGKSVIMLSALFNRLKRAKFSSWNVCRLSPRIIIRESHHSRFLAPKLMLLLLLLIFNWCWSAVNPFGIGSLWIQARVLLIAGT